MTQEEKLALLKAAGINVNGDLVLEKHVDCEIGNVEAGGIGIQIVNGSKTAVKVERQNIRSGVPRLVSDCFTYRWLKENPERIVRLYQALLKAEWIAKDTKPDDFLGIFGG